MIMSQHATETTPAEGSIDDSEWYGLGTIGWALWVGMVVMNFFGGMSALSGTVALAGYLLFCTVGSYLWIRFLKFVLQKILSVV